MIENNQITENDMLAAKEPLVKWGWVRAILFLICGAGIMFLLQFVKQILLYNNGIDFGLEYMFFNQALKCFAFILGIFLLRKFIDRKSMVSIGYTFKPKFRKDLIFGIGLGFGMVAIIFIILILIRAIAITNIHFPAYNLLLVFAIFIAVAFREESVSRGYMLISLMSSMNKYVALLATSLIFAAFHLGSPTITTFSFINIVLAGLLMGVYYIHQKNLWFPIGLHFGWNFALGAVSGSAISGHEVPSIIQIEILGNDILTGGAFGFEGSIFAPIIIILATLFIHFKFKTKTLNKLR